MNHLGRPPGHSIMSMEQMLAMERERTETRLYDRNEDGDAKIRKLIAQTTTELANLPEKIDIRNVEAVRSVVKAYMISCYNVGSVPSKSGTCRAMGLSRQAVDSFLSKNSSHPSAEFLRVTFDAEAELLSHAALSNSTNMVLSIFLLKAVFGYKETYVLEAPVDNSYVEELTPDQIAEKYSYLPEE